MADMLEGTSGHAHFAPLSHAQTIAISRHLQDQIKALQNKFEDVHRGLEETNGAMTGFFQTQSNSGNSLQQLQDNLASISAVVEANTKDIKRTNTGMHKLQAGLDSTNDGLTALRDDHKITNNMLLKHEQDLNNVSQLAQQLKDTVERKTDNDIMQLRDDLSKTNMNLKHLKGDEESLREIVREERDKLRDTNAQAKCVSDQLGEANTLMKILEQRLNDTTAKQKATTRDVDNLSTATLKLHDEHEHTKVSTADLQASLKKAHSHMKQIRDGLERTATGLGMAQEKVEEHNMAVDTLRQNLDQANCKILTLKETQERSTVTIQEMGQQLVHIGATAQAVKAGLQEQSSLLLPNIHMDSAEARAASARHGNLLNSTHHGTTSPKSMNMTTPRSKFSKSGGLNATTKGGVAQNQLAWT